MHEFGIDHAVVRWCTKREAVIVWYPNRTIRPNYCPVKIVRTIDKGGIEDTHLGLLAYEFTVNGQGYPHCEEIFRQIDTTRGWRLSIALEYMIRHGRMPIPQATAPTTGEHNGAPSP